MNLKSGHYAHSVYLPGFTIYQYNLFTRGVDGKKIDLDNLDLSVGHW